MDATNVQEQDVKQKQGTTQCCVMMDYALNEHYVYPTLTINMDAGTFDVHPPSIQGEKLTERGRKRKPSLLVNYCPWCGKKLAKDKQS